MREIKRMWGIPQEILYTICVAAWNMCSQNLLKFSSHSPLYTEAFIADALQAVQDAKQLPESRQTIAFRKEARVNLLNATRLVQLNWQTLKTYIIRAFAEDMVQAKLEAAGSALYSKASIDNWTGVRSLIDMTNTFITNNVEELIANNNMPADFQATFKANGDNCIALSALYNQTDREKEMATAGKIDANNAIYASLIKMLKDGQLIFQDDAILKPQFTYSYLVSKYRGDGSASLKGYIVDELNRPVEGVAVLSENEKYGAVTNSKGHYKITRIEAGTYIFNITCPGYSPISQAITFAAGTASKGNFELTNLLKKVA